MTKRERTLRKTITKLVTRRNAIYLRRNTVKKAHILRFLNNKIKKTKKKVIKVFQDIEKKQKTIKDEIGIVQHKSFLKMIKRRISKIDDMDTRDKVIRRLERLVKRYHIKHRRLITLNDVRNQTKKSVLSSLTHKKVKKNIHSLFHVAQAHKKKIHSHRLFKKKKKHKNLFASAHKQKKRRLIFGKKKLKKRQLKTKHSLFTRAIKKKKLLKKKKHHLIFSKK